MSNGEAANGRPQTRVSSIGDAHDRRSSFAGEETSSSRTPASRSEFPTKFDKADVNSDGESQNGVHNRDSKTSMHSRRAGRVSQQNGIHQPRNINPQRFEPRHSSLSQRSPFIHSGFLDENLMISNSKLDSTLLRMFSQEPYPRGGAMAQPSSTGSQADEISMAPVMWRVHPMDPIQKETLEREMTFIADCVNPLDILGDLCRQNVLTSMDYNQLNRIEGQGDRAVTRLMVKTLQRRGQNAYPAFLQALQAHGYVDVCERLLESERALKYGMRVDRPLADWENQNRISPSPFSTSPSFKKIFSPLATDFNHYPLHNSLPLNFFSPGYHSPLSNTMPQFTLPLSPSANPQPHNLGFGYSGRLSPLMQEPMKLNHIERQLDSLKDELKDLHDDMKDLKSALRQGQMESKPEPEIRNGNVSRATHHDNQPDLEPRPLHHQPAGTPRIGPLVQDTPPLGTQDDPAPNEMTVMLSPEQVKAYKVIEAQQLNRHLKDLQEEVKALHDDVTALSTSRSLKDGRKTRSDWSMVGEEIETPLERNTSRLGYGPKTSVIDEEDQITLDSNTSRSAYDPKPNFTPIDRQGSFFTINPLHSRASNPRRTTHRDFDPLPSPRSIQGSPQKRSQVQQAAAPKRSSEPEAKKAKNKNVPARVTHESHDPLPREPISNIYKSLDFEDEDPSKSKENFRDKAKDSISQNSPSNPDSKTSEKPFHEQPDTGPNTQRKPHKVGVGQHRNKVNSNPDNPGVSETIEKNATNISSNRQDTEKESAENLNSNSSKKVNSTAEKGTDDSSAVDKLKANRKENEMQTIVNQNKPLQSKDQSNAGSQTLTPNETDRTISKESQSPRPKTKLSDQSSVADKQNKPQRGRGRSYSDPSQQVSLIKEKVRQENDGYYGQDVPSHGQDTLPEAQKDYRYAGSPEALKERQSNGRVQETKTGSQNANETQYGNLGYLTNDLQQKVKTLKEEIAALRAQKNAATPRSQIDTRRDQENQAQRLERQLGELYGQLRTLRGDVSQLKTDKQKKVSINEPREREKALNKAQQQRDPVAPQEYPAAGQHRDHKTPQEPSTMGQHTDPSGRQERSVTRQGEPAGKQSGPKVNRRQSSPVYLRPKDVDDTPRHSSEGDHLGTIQHKGVRITTPTAILGLPTEGGKRARRITSPHTVLPDHSLPWPEATRIRVSS